MKVFRKINKNGSRYWIFFGITFLMSIFFQAKSANTGKLTGLVVDDEFGFPLEKAVVTIPGTLVSVLTDQQGNFRLNLVGGNYSIKVNCPGYFEKYYNVSVSDGIHTPMYIVKLQANATGREMQQKISSFEKSRQIGISTETFNVWQTDEQKGNQEFNLLFRTLPSVSFWGNGNGFNNSEIGFRGNDAVRSSYAFNGILLNNTETGNVSPAMLSGLTDWAGQIQVVSGQASNLQSETNYGGLVNVVSIAPHEKPGVEVSGIYGNNGFLKTTATVHSGLSKYGWATTLQLSRTAGDGISQNTAFEQYGLFLNVHKEINQFHSFLLNLNAVIQQHDRNFADSIGAYNRYSTKYNSQWGYLEEKPFSVSTNYERSPMISFTHFWHHRKKTHITTQIFAQLNQSAQLHPAGNLINQGFNMIPRDDNGQLLFDEAVNWNQGMEVAGMGLFRFPNSEGQFINSETSGISVLSPIESGSRLGLRTMVTREINKQTDVSFAANIENYQNNHFGAVNNILGADGFVSFSDVNLAAGFPVENYFEPKFWVQYNSPDKTAYYYQSQIQTGGISARLNYQTDRLNWYLAGSASVQNIRRKDYYNYLADDDNRTAELTFQPAGNIQTGLRFNFWKYHSFHVNSSYGSYRPLFSSIFPSYNNWQNPETGNEQAFNAELGYTIFSRKLKVEATVYQSKITNKSLVSTNDLNDGDAFGLISGANERHRGVELKTSYKLTKNFQLNVNGSLSDWKYATDATATTYGSTNEPNKKTELWLKGIRIANAPQLSLFAEAEYRWAHNFYIRANYYRAQQNYMPFGLNDFEQLTDRTEYKQAQLPKYDLIGASANYLVKFRKLMELNLILGVQNILDTEYIERSFGSAAEGTAGYTGNRVYYGPGRTWFAGLRMLF